MAGRKTPRGRRKGLFDERKAPAAFPVGARGTAGNGAGVGLPFTPAGPRPPLDPRTGLPSGLSVGELTRLIRGLIRDNFPPLWVEGELSNFRRYASGHCYFTLKDAEAQLACVLWRSQAARLKFSPADGAKVLARGRTEVYASRGQYQLVVDRLEPTGLGALAAAFEELKNRLAAEGLFARERKRPLPAFPRCLGVITSASGAAVRDILEITRRRRPGLDVILAPVRVQGAEAAGEIARALADFNKLRCADVLIVGRGGGSLEDLWAFNEETTVRAVAGSRIPVVSAVGHETDVTLTDLAADVRVATPSHAAETVTTPDREELRARPAALRRALSAALAARVAAARERLAATARSPVLRRPEERLERLRERLDELQARLAPAGNRLPERLRERLAWWTARLEGLSPLNVLARGYSVTRRADGKVLRAAADAPPGTRLLTKLADGEVRSVVED